MNLVLRRWPSNETCTIGEIYGPGGKFICYTCEDPVREKKIAGKTAFPAGIYQVSITNSQRFKRPLPLLHDVPGYEGIRIHPGNGPEDTEGCILPGMSVQPGDKGVLESRIAFRKVFDLIDDAEDEVWIDVRNG